MLVKVSKPELIQGSVS